MPDSDGVAYVEYACTHSPIRVTFEDRPLSGTCPVGGCGAAYRGMWSGGTRPAVFTE